MIRHLRLFLKIANANIQALMAYKADFLVSFFAGVLSQTIGLLFLFVLFGNIPAVAGWNLYEVALLYGYMFVSEGIMTLFFQGTNGIKWQVRSGQLDRHMLRPLSVVFQICALQTNLAGVGTVVTGLAVIGYSLAHLGLALPLWKILFLIISMPIGAFIRVNINFSTSSISFWLQGAGGIHSAVYKIQDMAKYPLAIYPKAFRVMLVTVLPFAAISYVPAAVILGKEEPWFASLLIVGALVVYGIRRGLFMKALERYEGAGN